MQAECYGYGIHELLHFQTNQKITCQYVTKDLVSQAIIAQVEKLPEMNGMPTGLKITNRTNLVLYDRTWTKKVDFDAKYFNDKNILFLFV